MTTPCKAQIMEKAQELYAKFQFQAGCPELAKNICEENELKEDGFWSVAVSELMSSPYKRYEDLEQPEKSIKEIEKKIENFEKKELSFDVDLAIDSGFYVSGTSQSGKSNLAKCIVQKLIQNGIRVFVVDPSKAWTHDSPIKNVLLVDTKINQYLWHDSTVFDVSALSTRFKVLFVNQLCKDIYEMHVDGYEPKEFIVFEEAQTYLPQGCTRLAIRRSSPLESVLDVVTVGANYGLRFGLITQFPALCDKAPIKICQQRYFGWTWERNDTNYVKAFLGKEWATKLQGLQKGEFVYQCRDKTELIKTPCYGQIAHAEGFNYGWVFQ